MRSRFVTPGWMIAKEKENRRSRKHLKFESELKGAEATGRAAFGGQDRGFFFSVGLCR